MGDWILWSHAVINGYKEVEYIEAIIKGDDGLSVSPDTQINDFEENPFMDLDNSIDSDSHNIL